MPAGELPDVEAIVVAFLNERVDPAVATKVANPRPARYVRAWRTGGGAINRVLERVQITVTCGASKDAGGSVQASADARACRGALLNEYTAMPLVRGVTETTGPYDDPDPDTGEDRYTFTHELSVRATF